MTSPLEGKTALITGGTMGIGLATALALSRHGAECAITYKWGTADLDEVRDAFEKAGASEPQKRAQLSRRPENHEQNKKHRKHLHRNAR